MGADKPVFIQTLVPHPAVEGFHIYPIDTIDRGIELLTGVRAGSINEPGTINYLVAERFRKMSETMRSRGGIETRIVQEAGPTPPAPKPPEPPEPPR